LGAIRCNKAADFQRVIAHRLIIQTEVISILLWNWGIAIILRQSFR